MTLTMYYFRILLDNVVHDIEKFAREGLDVSILHFSWKTQGPRDSTAMVETKIFNLPCLGWHTTFDLHHQQLRLLWCHASS